MFSILYFFSFLGAPFTFLGSSNSPPTRVFIRHYLFHTARSSILNVCAVFVYLGPFSAIVVFLFEGQIACANWIHTIENRVAIRKGSRVWDFTEIMAVQAQYPSNAYMPELWNRAMRDNNSNRNYTCPAAVVSAPLAEDFQQQQQNLFRMYNSANFGQVLNGTVFSDPESELTCNLSGPRKRPRDDDQLLLAQQRQRISQQQLQLMTMPEFQQKNAAVAPASISQPSHLVSTGLQLAYDDSRVNQTATSTSGRGGNISALLSLLGDDLAAQLQQQNDEVERFIRLQSEKVRIALEEKRQRHSRALVATVEEGMIRKLKEKETELENASRRNAELEDCIKQLSMESQIWQNMAKTNEAMVNTLRSNLEQVVAQSREQSKEGYGDSEADDAASCCYDDMADVHARTMKENKELKEQRTCRVCKTNDICILLLPCRHLCLCKECESRIDACPLCNSMKNASVQIYMS